MNNTEITKEKKHWLRNSNTARLFIIGVIIVFLLLPLSFIKSLIFEREQRQNEVVAEIHQRWGEAIQLYGPVLKLPYKIYSEKTIYDKKTGETKIIRDFEIADSYFFPKTLNVEGKLDGNVKSLGIYSTSVFSTKMEILGDFGAPDFDALDIKEEDVLWEKAQFIIQTTNLKGINDAVVINIKGHSLAFESNFAKTSQDNNNYNRYGKYVSQKRFMIETKTFNAKDLLGEKKEAAFSLKFNASGSKKFEIIPIGKETKMHLISEWKDTKFCGEYLPYNPDKIKENGFEAKWKVLQMNRPYSQQFKELPNLSEYAFGVDFIILVDDYQQNERSVKYGYLMITLTFLLFFIIQTLSKINIHPFQYLMIGLALVIFYTLLISISEHSSFSTAYPLASLAVMMLITLYSKSILKTWKFPIFIGISLSVLYSFIFVIIQLETYSLLVGSIGLFTILAAVMYASRKIDWG